MTQYLLDEMNENPYKYFNFNSKCGHQFHPKLNDN
jgi:hypothetical protein